MSSLRAPRGHVRPRLRSVVLFSSLALGVVAAGDAVMPRVAAQVRPIYSRGTAGLVQVLERLQTTASLMHTGAHPDDEDSSLIARVARGDHARVAYLSLNRGEGGQNIIGLELFDALGVIRTEELLQARTLDGGEQLFTTAFDFGFTKTIEEAATKYGEERILGDMVRAIRLYRPQVIVARFTGTPADGHGQHQLSGRLTPIAFKAAADPARFPEHMKEGLHPWQAKKLYVGEGFRATPGEGAMLRLPTGIYDPLLGRTYNEIALEGRSEHKTQEMGMIERRGPQSSGLRLLATAGLPGAAAAATNGGSAPAASTGAGTAGTGVSSASANAAGTAVASGRAAAGGGAKGATNGAAAAETTGAPTAAGAEAEGSVFDGIDTSVPGIAALVGGGDANPALRDALAAMQRAAATALKELVPNAPARIIPVLADGLRATRAARAALKSASSPSTASSSPAATSVTAGAAAIGRADADALLAFKEDEFQDALVRATGLTVDVLADKETAAPGESVRATVNSFVPDGAPITLGAVSLRAPAGWDVATATGPATEDDGNPFARFFRETPTRADSFTLRIAANAPFTTPYWLQTPRKGNVFDWSHVESPTRNRPFAAPLVVAALTVEIGGVPVTLVRPLEYRYGDSVRGEIRRPFEVVPAITVAFDAQLEIVPLSGLKTPRRVAVRLQNQTLKEGSGVVALTLPAGWTSTPAEAPFTVKGRGDRAAVVFTVTPAATTAAGTYQLAAQATVNGQAYRTAMRTLEYPHIQTHRLFDPAVASARVLDLTVAPVKVGYVMGSGDQVPDAIRRMGLDVTLLNDEALATGDLSQFDTIVVGVRASERRPAFVSNNGRLLQFARDGGTLIVQYQQPDYVGRGLAPLPAEMPSRVIDETAPVTILQPQHPAFTFPNRITEADWKDWVQERNLYAFSTFDPQYVPLLETRDPGEPPQRGGEVYLRLGKGHYVYTSYAWFRQLPAGVPGAYRLFANLLSLPKAPGN